MSWLVRSKQLKTIAGTALILYGALGHHGLMLVLGAGLLGWGLAQAAALLRRGDQLADHPPTDGLTGGGPRPPFGGLHP